MRRSYGFDQQQSAFAMREEQSYSMHNETRNYSNYDRQNNFATMQIAPPPTNWSNFHHAAASGGGTWSHGFGGGKVTVMPFAPAPASAQFSSNFGSSAAVCGNAELEGFQEFFGPPPGTVRMHEARYGRSSWAGAGAGAGGGCVSFGDGGDWRRNGYTARAEWISKGI